MEVILAIVSAVLNLGILIIDALPPLDFTFPEDFLDNMEWFFNGIAFFLPMSFLLSLLQIKLLILQFRINWALILRVKSFIPGVSGG